MQRTLHRAVALAALFLTGAPSSRSQEPVKAAALLSSYPNSADGLRLLLQHVMAAAQRGDEQTVEAAIRDMEIPNAEKWFVDTFGEETGESWAQPYNHELTKNDKRLQELLEQLAQEDGEVSATKVGSNAKPGSLEWGLSHGLKHPADFYLAEFRSSEAPKDAGDFIGYFVFVDGKFRWDSGIQVVKLLPLNADGVQSLKPLPAPSNQSTTNTAYVSARARFTLTVPQDWRTNDELARAKFGIGALSSSDGRVNLLIQQMPGAMVPAEFAKELDARGNRLLPGYRKVSDSQLRLDGRDCAVISFQFTNTRQSGDAFFPTAPEQTWMVLIPIERGVLAFSFVTSSSFFKSEQPMFEEIVRSYHSMIVTQAVPTP
jgi:hypothetical protein